MIVNFKRLIVWISVLLPCFGSMAQTSEYNSASRNEEIQKKIDDKKFDESILQDAILNALNDELLKRNAPALSPNEILGRASADYAQYLSTIDDAKPSLGGKKQSLEYRLRQYGGTANSCVELCAKNTLKKGKEPQSYKDLASDFIFKWFNSKLADQLADPRFLIVGIGCKTDELHKKIYVSLLLGNYSTLNAGAQNVKSSGMDITTKSKGLKPYDPKLCKNCERFKNMDTLQKGLSIEGNTIYLETQQKFLKRILKNVGDGFAVDVVQKKQYPCGSENIIDKSLPSKGIVTKKLTTAKLVKLNMYKGKDAKTKFKAPLGELPADISSDYELNLIVFQDKVFCKNIKHSYTEIPRVGNTSKLKILGDTLTFYNDFEYKPKPDTTVLAFKIPFSLGKSNYNSSDIKPVLEALNEPAFNIISLKVTSFSSIDGSEEKNVQLRQDRAQAIANAFKQLQKGSSIHADISTSDSWKLFFNDIKGTKWDSLKSKTPEQVLDIIKKNKLEPQLESILAKHRFAQIDMKIIYDISSVQKEKAFVLKKFQQALDKGDIVTALNIQKYIIKKVRRGYYSPVTVSQMQIPADSSRFAGMQMNKLWLDYVITAKPVDSAFYAEVCRLNTLDPKNIYVMFNKLYCEIKLLELTDEGKVGDMQLKIEALRTSKLRKSDVDPLNVEFQIKVLQAIGNTMKVTDEQKLIRETLERIKAVIDINTGDWKNALSLAQLFMQMDDFEFPINLLEPFVENGSVDDRLLFTYLSACSHSDYKTYTGIFERALQTAFTHDKARTCKLFTDKKMSFQIFENPNVKKMVCEQCGF